MQGLIKIKEFDDEEDLDFYNENLIEDDLENDEISSEEEGFMIGFLKIRNGRIKSARTARR